MSLGQGQGQAQVRTHTHTHTHTLTYAHTHHKQLEKCGFRNTNELFYYSNCQL